MVHIEYEISRGDFLAVRRVQEPRWRRWLAWVLFGILGTICLGVGTFARLQGDVRGWWVLPAIFVVSFALGQVERWWRRERAWREVQGLGPITAEFSDAGVGIAAAGERAFLEWRVFSHYRETAALLLVYQGKSFFRYLPLRAFNSPADLDAVRGLLHTHVRLTRYQPRQVAPAAFPVMANVTPDARESRPAEPAAAEPAAAEQAVEATPSASTPFGLPAVAPERAQPQNTAPRPPA